MSKAYLRRRSVGRERVCKIRAAVADGVFIEQRLDRTRETLAFPLASVLDLDAMDLVLTVALRKPHRQA